MKNLKNESLAFESVNENAVNFRELFESLSLMFYVENFVPQYELEYISPAFESLGYTVEEIYANPKILDQVMHPDDLLMMKEANKEIYNQTKTESDYHYRIYRKNGELRWWKDCGRPVFNEKGERVKWFGVISDITDQKIAEQKVLESKIEIEQNAAELAQSYETTHTILESIGDLLVVVGDDGIINKVNDSAAAMLGYEKDEFIGQHIKMLTQTETFLTNEEYERMKLERKLLGIEKDFVCKNGNVLKVSISSSVLKNYQQGAVIVAKDITKRIEDEQELRRYAADLEQRNREYEALNKSFKKTLDDLHVSQAELISTNNFTNLIMDSMVDFVVVLDMDLNIKRVNPAALRINGYQESEIIGRNVNLGIADNPFDETGVKLLRKKGQIKNLNKLNLCKDGTVIPMSISISLLKDENGDENGIVCVGRDISDIIKAREKIEQSNEKLRLSNRELQDFAYVASHDLQEPLRKIRAFGDRLEKKFAETLGAEGSDYIQRMQNAAGRMQTLINDLLTFSRVVTKTHPFQTTDITEIAAGVISDLEVRIEETMGKVEIEELPVIDADPLQMRQLFQNLIGNALKFHRPDEPPHIKVSSNPVDCENNNPQIYGINYPAGSDKKMCRIIVQDNGIGFEEKYLDRIFTVFQRLHGRESYEGSGIGLSVCRKIVERHGGEITARSEPDKGSTFLITMPVKQNQEESVQL